MTSTKARVAAVFTAVAHVLGFGLTVGSDVASARSRKTSSSSHYKKTQKNKAHNKASASVKNGDNRASANGGNANGGRCLNVGSGNAQCNGGGAGDGGTAVAGNITVQIPVAAVLQTNSADADDSNGGSGALG
jgi:hypothetical protein